MIDWTLEPIFNSYSLAATLLAAMLVGWLFIREDRELSRWRRYCIGFLRLLLIAIVAMGIFRPGLTFTRKSTPRGAVGVMVDLTQSMELSSGIERKTRWQVEQDLWDKIVKSQDEIGKELPFVIYGYDEKLRKIEVNAENKTVVEPVGATTDVGKTLSELIAAQVDPPLSAVIWMGDATQTVLPASVDPQQTARQLTQLDIPIFLFGIGPRGDGDRIKDLALEGVPEQVNVYSSANTQILGMLHATSVMNRSVPVRLFLKGTGKPPRLLAEQVLRPTQPDQTLPFRLSFTSPDAGAYELEIQVEAEKDELSLENNRALCFLNVSKGGSRVLYLEGEPRLEQSFLRRSLESNIDFQVDFRWIDRKEGPQDLTQQLKSAVYDAYILGDLDASLLTPATNKMLADRVREGAGLITLGGFQTYGPGGYTETPIGELLPIQMDTLVRQRLGSPIQMNLHYPPETPMRLRPPEDGNGAGAIAQLAEGPENLKAWMSLAPMRGANRWKGLKNIPGSRVVIATDKREPMAVACSAGEGRVFSVAFDTTYLWWLQGNAELHKKFWRQAVLWVIRRENPEEGIHLEMPKRRFYRNQGSDFMVRWNPGATQKPIPEDIKASLWRDGKELGPLTLARDGDRLALGKLPSSTSAGRFEIVATCTSSSGDRLESRLPFIVLDQSVEGMKPAPDWSLMQQMAKLNESAGGELLVPEQIDLAISKLKERKKTSTIEIVESYRLGQGTLDSWTFFVLVVGTLTFQWFLRKRWRLA